MTDHNWIPGGPAPVYALLGGSCGGLVRRVRPDGWALRGERTLWTGRPVHARITLADAGLALYLTVVLVVVAVFAPHWLRGLPVGFKVLAAIAWGAGALQALGMLVVLLVTGPAKRRRTVYEVTNYRVIVSGGRGADDVTSVYLDQLGEPAVRPNRGGTGDVLLGAGSGGAQGRRLGRTFFQPTGLGLAAVNSVTVLRAVPDAVQACQVIAEARRRFLDDEIDAFSSSAHLADPVVPSQVALGPGEDMLWTGGPARIPWWFGGQDVYLTAFALVWLAFVTGMGVIASRSGGPGFFLVWVGLMALVGGVYPAAGRVVHRRLRIRRSRYVLTSRRLVTTWRTLGGGPPVMVQAPLNALLPPVLRGTSVITGLAAADGSSRLRGWRALPWPAATVTPPVFIGLANPHEVAGLIGDAQVATRALVNKSRPGRAGAP